MFVRSPDSAFRRFRRTGNSSALARVFDLAGPELLSLARHLASSEAAAEDLVQATFVTAIEARTDYDRERAVLPWLTGILANHARAARRRARRAVDGERVHSPLGRDPVAAAEESELRESLARVIECLPEAYRPVLRLYLEQGLEPIEIARALDRAPSTVRTQVSRGLDMLRRALPVGLTAGAVAITTPGRGLAAVRAAVIQQCGGPVGGSAAATEIEVLASLQTKIILVGAAVLAAVVLGFLLVPWPPIDRIAATPDASGAAELRDDLVPTRGEVLAATTTGERVEVGSDQANRAPDPPVIQARALVVRIVSARDHAPLQGLVLRLQDPGRLQDIEAVGPPVVTNGDGMARFVDPPPGTVFVFVDRGGGGRAVESPVQGELRVEIEVPVGIEVLGLVLDADDQPVPGATILAYNALLEPSDVTRTDAAGRFRLVDVQPGIVLAAEAPGWGPSLGHPVRGKTDDVAELTLRLGRGVRQVSGQVHRPDGAPAPGALIAIMIEGARKPSNELPHPRPRMTRTDGEGRFVLAAPSDLPLVVVASPAAYGEDAPGRAGLQPGAGNAVVDVFLCRGAVLEGKVRDGKRAAVGATVVAWPEHPRDDLGSLLANRLLFRRTPVDEQGQYQITGLVPGEYRLTVDNGQGGRAEQLRTLIEGERARWDVDFAAGLGLRVRVEPAQPAWPNPRWSLMLSRIAGHGREFVNQRGADEEGRADFANLASGDYEVTVGLRVVGESRGDLVVAVQTPVSAGSEVVISVPAEHLPSANLRGRLINGEGEPLAGQALRLTSFDGSASVSWCSATAGQDGRFACGPLPPGEWSVRLGERGKMLTTVQLVRDETRELGDVSVRER